MNLSKFAGALMAAGFALALGLSAATASYAQNPEDEVKPQDRKAAKNAKADKAAANVNVMEVAPPIITAAGVSCEPVAGKFVASTKLGEEAVQVYELACKTDPGFIVAVATSDNKPREFYSCVALAKVHETKADAPVCTLPENLPEHKWMTPVVQKFIPGCEVSKVRIVGSAASGDNKFDRYEVACASGVGGLLDYPQFTSKAPVEFGTCLVYEQTTASSKCTLTTKAQMIEYYKPVVAKADPKCQVTDARYVAINVEGSATYYEFACATPPGFVALVNNNDQSYNRMIACSAALALGGCKLTDAGVVASSANGEMTNLLKAAGRPCNVTEFDVKGTSEATKRDYVEFKCPEQPWGLIGFVPQPGTQGATDVRDCFGEQIRRQPLCTYVSVETLQKQFDKLIKIAKPDKGCDVKEVRYIGESGETENAIIAELACGNKRGYIAVIAPDRNSLLDAVPCTVAKSQRLDSQCEIAGNGTYAAADD